MLEIEPLNSGYDEDKVQSAIAKGLSQFYENLIGGLNKIDLEDILKRKNPYLYRAKGISSATQLVDSILAAYISSSEETIFGNVFFEPLAIEVSGGQKAVTEGADVTVDKGDTIYTIAVKSGTSVFNYDSKKRQLQNFQSASRRVQQAHKLFVPVIGYGYGKKRISKKTNGFCWQLAGQDFWAWLTGDSDFYLKIVRFMGTKPEEYAATFDEAYYKAENRLVCQFTTEYCMEDGTIDWNKLIKFNSGSAN